MKFFRNFKNNVLNSLNNNMAIVIYAVIIFILQLLKHLIMFLWILILPELLLKATDSALLKAVLKR